MMKLHGKPHGKQGLGMFLTGNFKELLTLCCINKDLKFKFTNQTMHIPMIVCIFFPSISYGYNLFE